MAEKKVTGPASYFPSIEKKYGVYGLAALGPVLIGTQFAAAAAVSAGVKPLRSSILITVSMFLWAIVIAVAVVALDIKI